MWDPCSLSRDQTCTPCIGSTESQPLGHQGSPILLVCVRVSSCIKTVLTCPVKIFKTPQLWGFVVCLSLDLGLGSLRRGPQDKDSSVFGR